MAKPDQNNVTPLRKSMPCPQCGKTSSRDAYPFCSKRCADLDLGAWLNGSYTIAIAEEDTSIPEE